MFGIRIPTVYHFEPEGETGFLSLPLAMGSPTDLILGDHPPTPSLSFQLFCHNLSCERTFEKKS